MYGDQNGGLAIKFEIYPFSNDVYSRSTSLNDKSSLLSIDELIIKFKRVYYNDMIKRETLYNTFIRISREEKINTLING